jgi:hypothetical protein
MYYNSLRDINGEFSQHASMPHHLSPLKNNYENYRSSGMAREQGGGGDGAPELILADAGPELVPSSTALELVPTGVQEGGGGGGLATVSARGALEGGRCCPPS